MSEVHNGVRRLGATATPAPSKRGHKDRVPCQRCGREFARRSDMKAVDIPKFICRSCRDSDPEFAVMIGVA